MRNLYLHLKMICLVSCLPYVKTDKIGIAFNHDQMTCFDSFKIFSPSILRAL
jgi:hypothetical protein